MAEDKERISTSAAAGLRALRCARKDAALLSACVDCRRSVLKVLRVPVRSILRIRVRSCSRAAARSCDCCVVCCRVGLFWRSWSEGRKKGACSGFLGGAMGLLRWRIRSRCRRFCQRERGTRERETRSEERLERAVSRDSGVGVVLFGVG